MKKLLLALLICCALIPAQAQVSTPGTGVRWNFDSLSRHFPTTVIRVDTSTYHVTNVVNIQPGDSLYEYDGADVVLDSGATFNFRKCSVLLSDVYFMASDTGKKFLRIRVDSVLDGQFFSCTVRYGKGMSLINSRAMFYNCQFFRNKTAAPDPSGAVSLLGSYAEFKSGLFYENSRSALNVAANGNSGMKVDGTFFNRNNTENGNYPQINIGNANDSGIVIRNCTIRGLFARGGGIGFLNLVPSNYRIDIRNNTIYRNRYGITVTGRGISGIIANNVIDSNCIENNPALGGSGLNFQGDSSLNIIVTGNTIKQNLWGVTLQLSSATARAPKISFGRISPVNPADTGRNTFSANGNNGVNYAIYNNTPDTIWAQHNTWDDTSMAGIENTVFHHVDSAALGWVIFSPAYKAPVQTGIITISGNEDVQVWPNPVAAGSMIRVNSKLAIESYALISINGQSVRSGTPGNEKSSSVSTQNLAPGTYYLLLKGRGWQKTHPVLIQ